MSRGEIRLFALAAGLGADVARRLGAPLSVDVHNPAAFENAFRCRAENLEARPLLARHLAAALPRDARIAVVSPDLGVVAAADLAAVTVTSTVPPFRLTPALAGRKLAVLDVAPLLAAAIERLHGEGLLAELYEVEAEPMEVPV